MSAASDTAVGDVRKAREMARRVVEHYFGAKPRRLTHMSSGLSNFVFRASHEAGDLMVRISPTQEGINWFQKEQWAVAKARAAGVPTAEILEVGNEAIALPYMISRAARGREATHHDERLSILREMGRYAALVNSISTQGFGSVFDWSRNTLSRHETWNEFLFGELKLESRLEVLKEHEMLPAKRLDEIRSILEGVAALPVAPTLNHGDIRLKNVLVDDEGTVTAIIDWEMCLSSIAPHWELSVALHDLSIDEKQEFLQGYGLSEAEVREIAPVVKALNIVNYAPYVDQVAGADDSAQMERYRTRLGGALDLYSL